MTTVGTSKTTVFSGSKLTKRVISFTPSVFVCLLSNHSWVARGRARCSSAAACQVLAPSKFPAFSQTFPCSKLGKCPLSHLLLCPGLPGFGGIWKDALLMLKMLPKVTTTVRVPSFFQSQLTFFCGSYLDPMEKTLS